MVFKTIGLRHKVRLYISKHVRRLLALNFIVGILSFVCDVVGLLNLSYRIALMGAIIGFIDFLAGSYLVLIHYKERNGNGKS